RRRCPLVVIAEVKRTECWLRLHIMNRKISHTTRVSNATAPTVEVDTEAGAFMYDSSEQRSFARWHVMCPTCMLRSIWTEMVKSWESKRWAFAKLKFLGS